MAMSSRSGNDETLDVVFAEIVRLRDCGDLEGALKQIDRYVELAPDRVGVELVRAGVLRDLDRSAEAVRAFRCVLTRLPRHTRASRGLFHALLDVDDVVGAQAEAARYLRLIESGEAARAPRDLKELYEMAVGLTHEEMKRIAKGQRDEHAKRKRQQ